MQYRYITDTYAVSGQIEPQDVATLKADGFTTIICNRPDVEAPENARAVDVREAAEAAGLTFLENPFSHQAFSFDLVDGQLDAMEKDAGKVFAYCATGNRCTILWGLAQAKTRSMTPDQIVATADAQGYDLNRIRPQLDSLTE
ncbi:TIGR01244 family sulfur transferase [Pelagovum pacificum]|uniref:TIGR01244 family phosphatase n=1 Tax=Pelagovum pacificum TaxID=2588711 RepID=A0A5C5GDP1_9RHOB|nr:TIGR01244 family sulfur transferase [Pelagovum pacificum]QQA44063.1 TIGR01244 family phosphatase [Pelagovum pacificum]TNY32808.1 TIGR01244 family phosphatase [Pelagovum pacificum]